MCICANHAFMYRILKVMENLKISWDFKIVMSKTVNVMKMYKYDHLIGRSARNCSFVSAISLKCFFKNPERL